MHPHFPRKKISWSLDADHILVMIAAPTLKTGCAYTISNSDYDKTIAVFNVDYS